MPDVKYIRAIFATAREHGISSEEVHDAIWAGWEKKSVKDLTTAEACQLLDGLRGRRRSTRSGCDSRRRHAMGNHGRRDYDRSQDPNYVINEREMQMLREAAALRNWDEGVLTRFIERQLGRPEIRTMAEFNRVFWPLKAMNRREGKYNG
ncbi:MAG: hypothetical protein ACE15B_19400 [Bryobacteraceae bacterium]